MTEQASATRRRRTQFLAVTGLYYTDEGDFSASDSAADYPHTIGNWFFVDGIPSDAGYQAMADAIDLSPLQ